MKKPSGIGGVAIGIGAALLAISPLIVFTVMHDEPKGPVCMAPGNRTIQLRPGLQCWIEEKGDGTLELLARDTPEVCTTTTMPGAGHKYGPYGIGDVTRTTCR